MVMASTTSHHDNYTRWLSSHWCWILCATMCSLSLTISIKCNNIPSVRPVCFTKCWLNLRFNSLVQAGLMRYGQIVLYMSNVLLMLEHVTFNLEYGENEMCLRNGKAVQIRRIQKLGIRYNGMCTQFVENKKMYALHLLLQSLASSPTWFPSSILLCGDLVEIREHFGLNLPI